MVGPKSLLRSRKAWIAVSDAIISLILYFAVKYADPSAAEDVSVVIAALQPVFLLWIGSIAYEDGKKLESGRTPGKD